MKFHAILPLAIDKGERIRSKDWMSEAWVQWNGKNFIDRYGMTFTPDLIYCMDREWEIVPVNRETFRLLTAGTRFKLDTGCQILTKIHEYNAINKITSQTFRIDDERQVIVVE